MHLEYFLGYAITELHKNPSCESLSASRDIEYKTISDLIVEMGFQIKNSTFLNRKTKEKQDKESSQDINTVIHTVSLKSLKILKKN